MYTKTIQTLDAYIERGIFPGYSAAFIQHDHVQTIIKGNAQRYPKIEALRPNLYYDLASVSKVFVTGILLAQMIERNEIDLDWPVHRFFPEMKERQVTIRHLVTHTSGLEGFIPNRNQLPADELVKALTGLKCGPTYHHTVSYTDTGFVLTGKIIEHILGKCIADCFDERIASPLALKHMTYGPLPSELCVPTEFVEERGGLIRGTVHDPKASVLQRSCGSAGLFATLDDVITYTKMLLNGGSYQGINILEKATVDSLFADWTPTRQAGRSLAWDLTFYQGEVWLRHTGFTGTLVLWNIQSQQAFIMLSNRIHILADTPQYNLFRDQLIEIFLQEAKSKKDS